MALKLEQKNSQKQQISKSPQLIKAIGLLEKPDLEVQQTINEELESNAMLEERSMEDVDDNTLDQKTNNDGEIIVDEGQVNENVDWDSYNPNNDTGWPDHIDQGNNLPAYERAASILNNDLKSRLRLQLILNKFNVVHREIGAYIIENINEDGRFPFTVEDICQEIGRYLPETVLKTLKSIQSFEPGGVSARDLRECLLIQAGLQHLRGSLVEIIIKNHLENIKNKKCDKIASALSVHLTDVHSAVSVIREMDPKPGKCFNRITGKYSFAFNYAALHIKPDIYVYKDGNDFRIEPENNYVPLRINRTYDKMLKANKNLSNEDRRYMEDKKKGAQFFIKSLEQRQKTIYRVTKSLIGLQREFFETGLITNLRPLISSDVAKDIQIDESTVRRTRKNKYMDTPHGLFEMNFFFDKDSFDTLDGRKVASKCIKELVRKIIESENKENPFRDQEIADILKTDYKIDVIRRTVLKYRDAMGFLSARLRRWPC